MLYTVYGVQCSMFNVHIIRCKISWIGQIECYCNRFASVHYIVIHLDGIKSKWRGYETENTAHQFNQRTLYIGIMALFLFLYHAVYTTKTWEYLRIIWYCCCHCIMFIYQLSFSSIHVWSADTKPTKQNRMIGCRNYNEIIRDFHRNWINSCVK